MKYSIEVCIKENQNNTDKGRILEELTQNILKHQQYDAVNTVRITGVEIDVMASHKVTGEKIFVECKAQDNTLSADVITKLYGNVMLKNVDSGWLITTGPLSKDAKGIVREWETENNSNRNKLAFFTEDRIIRLLIDSNEIINPEKIECDVNTTLQLSNNAVLILMPSNMVWAIPVVDNVSGLSTSVVAFDAKTGNRIKGESVLEEIKLHKSSLSSFQWLSIENDKTNEYNSNLLAEELESIVSVISGDDWIDYRPARPEDFIGRKSILSEIVDFIVSVNEGKSNTRLFSIKAPSGMGKSGTPKNFV